MAKNTDDTSVESELAKLARGDFIAGNGKTSPAVNPIMDACMRAADLIRTIPGKEIAEGEKAAKELEEIGATYGKRLAQIAEEFQQTCRAAAQELRTLRAVTKESAEETAEKLAAIGSAEAERHAQVSSNLHDMRGALQRIENLGKALP